MRKRSGSQTQKIYQEAARRTYDEPGIRIDGDVMEVSDGAFVQAWVWVPRSAVEKEEI